MKIRRFTQPSSDSESQPNHFSYQAMEGVGYVGCVWQGACQQKNLNISI